MGYKDVLVLCNRILLVRYKDILVLCINIYYKVRYKDVPVLWNHIFHSAVQGCYTIIHGGVQGYTGFM